MTSVRSLGFVLVFAALSVVSSHRQAVAVDYWVGPNGNDKGPGTKTTPFATLQFACDRARPGDTVRVFDGDYVGFNMTRGGTPKNRITFIAEGDKVRLSRNNPKTLDGINLEAAPYVTIDGFITNDMPRAGVRATHSDGVRIRRVRADNCAKWGIFTSFSNDAVIEYNVVSRARKEHGIYVSNSGDRPIIRGNVSYGNRACGIHMNGDITAGGDGIITGAIVDSNTIYGNGSLGGAAINADGVQDSKIVNNVIYDNRARGIALFKEDAAAPSINVLIANNTIVMAADSRWAINIKEGSTGAKLMNNIIINPNKARGDVLITPQSSSGFVSDHNVFSGRFSSDDGDSVWDLTTWKSKMGQDRNSIVATPEALFVNPARGDYRLRSGSAAIGAADPNVIPAWDRDARPRKTGARHDIGAYAFSAGS
jgi:parallel beta-helix repeat protein